MTYHTPPSHLKFQSWIQDGGRGNHVMNLVQLYPQPLYTASQVHTTSRSWDKGVLTDLCLTLYIVVCVINCSLVSVWEIVLVSTISSDVHGWGAVVCDGLSWPYFPVLMPRSIVCSVVVVLVVLLLLIPVVGCVLASVLYVLWTWWAWDPRASNIFLLVFVGCWSIHIKSFLL
jgi:hypothetical protein